MWESKKDSAVFGDKTAPIPSRLQLVGDSQFREGPTVHPLFKYE